MPAGGAARALVLAFARCGTPEPGLCSQMIAVGSALLDEEQFT